jgi:hypothetical protein
MPLSSTYQDLDNAETANEKAKDRSAQWTLKSYPQLIYEKRTIRHKEIQIQKHSIP